MQWDDGYLLGLDAMDDCHRSFVALLVRLQLSTEDELKLLFPELLEHLTGHLGDEDKLMERTQFPPRACHMDEHAAVLHSVQQVQDRLELGQVALARRLVEELAIWFPKHTQHLDSALAHWVIKHRAGGKPVVLKRRPTDVKRLDSNVLRHSGTESG
jgi:hemerythrin